MFARLRLSFLECIHGSEPSAGIAVELLSVLVASVFPRRRGNGDFVIRSPGYRLGDAFGFGHRSVVEVAAAYAGPTAWRNAFSSASASVAPEPM